MPLPPASCLFSSQFQPVVSIWTMFYQQHGVCQPAGHFPEQKIQSATDHSFETNQRAGLLPRPISLQIGLQLTPISLQIGFQPRPISMQIRFQPRPISPLIGFQPRPICSQIVFQPLLCTCVVRSCVSSECRFTTCFRYS